MTGAPESPLSREILERVEGIFGPLCEDANVLLWLSDMDSGQLIYVNSFCEPLWEMTRAELYADRFAAADRVHPDDRAIVMGKFACLSELGHLDETYRVVMPSGRHRWIRAWANYLPATGDAPAMTAGMLTDVTEQKTTGARLAVKQELARILAAGEPPVEAIPRLLRAIGEPLNWDAAGLWLLDPDQQALTCRSFWRRTDALAAFELASRRMVLRENEGLPGRAWSGAAEVFTRDPARDLHYVHRSAGLQAGITSVAAFPILAGDRVVGVLDFAGTNGLELDEPLREVVRGLARQLSLYLEHHRLDEAARRETRHLQIVSESLSQLLLTNSFQKASDALLKGVLEVTGSPMGLVAVVVRGEILRVLSWSGLEWDEFDNRDFFESVQRRSQERGYLDFPLGKNLLWSAVSRNATVMTGEPARHPDSRGVPPGHPELTAFLAVPLRADGEVIGELAVANRSGGYSTAEREGLEGLASLAGVLCQRYRSQKLSESLAEQLRQAQKMEAVGRLAGGVAHDFNNLLQIINGYTEMLSDAVADDEFARDAVERVRRAGARAASLTRQLLSFSRKQVAEPKVVDLGGLVLEAHKMFRRLIGEDIEVKHVIAPELWPVRVDPSQMDQLLMNLLVNARDAMPSGGRITVEIANVRFDGAPAGFDSTIPEGSWVRLSVCDTGVGIPLEIQSQVFEPFFTTKDRDRGTGLGLSTVFAIVQQSAGLIRLYSEVGKGTTFHIFLPAIVGQPITLAQVIEAQSAPRATETVLLVEDQEEIRKVVVNMLEPAGYTVIAAGDVDEALKLARAHAGTIDLLLTDVVMPALSGPQVADQVRRFRSGIAVLFMSGYSEHQAFPRGFADGGAHLLHKPFDRTSLLVAVRTALLTRASAQPVRAQIGHALVVDDAEVNRELVQRMLELKGFTVDTAAGGREALERLRVRHYDVVLLDVTMPDISGLDVVRTLRAQPRDPAWATPAAVPVLAITANTSAADRERARAAGMDDVLAKPIALEDLTRTLGTWVPAFQRAIAAAASSGEPSAEADRISALKVELGWQNALRIVTLFLADLNSKCTAIRGAVDRDDMVALQHATHALRGAAANLGAERLADVCLELESLARLGAVSGVRQHVTHLLEEATRVHDRVALACHA